MPHQPVVAIIGATGTVGQGIARTLQGAGWSVIAVGRDAARLGELATGFFGNIATVAGSVADDASAAVAAAEVRRIAPRLDAVITSVNLPSRARRLLDMPGEALAELFSGNVVTHLCAARAFLPLLAEGGRYIGLGGGMADFMFDGMGGASVCQAAQRNLFRFLSRESGGGAASVVELMLYSHIVGPDEADTAEPSNIRADEVGSHVLAILERPEEFPGPILTLKSRKQVGKPERA